MQDAIILYENGKAIGGEGHPTDADDITFNNTGTDLVSEEVESAIKEVNGKSAKSADLTSISESGTTASQAISAGTYFYLDGTLVRAKTAIASGATFTLNTNYEVVTAGALNDRLWKTLVTDATSANLSTVQWNEADVIIHRVGTTTFAITFHLNKNTPTGYYYIGSNSSGFVGARVLWNESSQTITEVVFYISGTENNATMTVFYR